MSAGGACKHGPECVAVEPDFRLWLGFSVLEVSDGRQYRPDFLGAHRLTCAKPCGEEQEHSDEERQASREGNRPAERGRADGRGL